MARCSAEAWIFATVSAAVTLTTHAVVAILAVGPLARDAGERSGIGAYRRANLLQARRVLDVGSGTGIVTQELAAGTRGEVTGIDLDPEMVAFAGTRGHRVDYRTGDAHALPFPDGWFDALVCSDAFHHFRDQGAAAREFARVVRPGGGDGAVDAGPGVVCSVRQAERRLDRRTGVVVAGCRDHQQRATRLNANEHWVRAYRTLNAEKVAAGQVNHERGDG